MEPVLLTVPCHGAHTDTSLWGAGGALSSLGWGFREPLGNSLGSWCLLCPSPGPLWGVGGMFSGRLYSHVCLPNYTASLASAVA